MEERIMCAYAEEGVCDLCADLEGIIKALRTRNAELEERLKEAEESKKLLFEVLSADILLPVDLAYRISKSVGLVKESILKDKREVK